MVQEASGLEQEGFSGQRHLTYRDRVNQGGYYTPFDWVEKAWEMVGPRLDSETVIMDTACGYGHFLRRAETYAAIGCDLDPVALSVAKRQVKQGTFFQTNALSNVKREAFGIPWTSRLVILGNPPYNDRTSLIRHTLKDRSLTMDQDLISQDLGISFLLSYNKLRADWICVLHPLSYLIKAANFKRLKNFALNYRLLDGLVISSHEFPESSKYTPFPIVIALYRRESRGMDYPFIWSFPFRTRDKGRFSLSDFDYISRYIPKYPSKKNRKEEGTVFFWPMRDINALKRNRTFVAQSETAIKIPRETLIYYIYVDVFKRNIPKIPFYFGNSDVMIDDALFKRYQRYFIQDACTRHPFLRKYTPPETISVAEVRETIDRYFRALLGRHYIRCFSKTL